MQNYSSPQVIEYGNSSDLIKGVCGWGGEGITFDKTDSILWLHFSCWGNFGFCQWNECSACNEQCADTCSNDDDCDCPVLCA